MPPLAVPIGREIDSFSEGVEYSLAILLEKLLLISCELRKCFLPFDPRLAKYVDQLIQMLLQSHAGFQRRW